MIAATDLLLSVVVFVAGFIGGRISKRAPDAKPDPIRKCSCGHARGFHTDGTGKCNQKVARIDGIALKSTTQCTCQVYDGPERPEDVIRGFQG